MIKNVVGWLRSHLSYVLYTSIGLLILFSIYLFRLGSHVRGDNPYESILFLEINGLKDIAENISYGPIKLAELVAIRIDEPNVTLTRMISVLLVVAAVILIIRLTTKWHTLRIGLLTGFLFAVSTYSLQLARFTNHDALFYVAIPFLLLAGTWLKSKRHVSRIVFVMPVVAILLYLPGMILFLLPLAIIFRKRLLLAWRYVSKKSKIIGSISAGLILLPLLVSLIMYPSQITKYLGIDRLIAGNFKAIYDALIQIPDALFLNGPDQPFRWLVGTPILDVASIILLLLGIYAYIKGPHTLRARLLLYCLIAAVVLISIGSMVSISLLVPLVYVVIASGLAFLLKSWFTVFPRNPAARNTALAVIIIFVGLIASYHLQRYFIAWPNAPETRNALSAQSTEVIQ